MPRIHSSCTHRARILARHTATHYLVRIFLCMMLVSVIAMAIWRRCLCWIHRCLVKFSYADSQCVLFSLARVKKIVATSNVSKHHSIIVARRLTSWCFPRKPISSMWSAPWWAPHVSISFCVCMCFNRSHLWFLLCSAVSYTPFHHDNPARMLPFVVSAPCSSSIVASSPPCWCDLWYFISDGG